MKHNQTKEMRYNQRQRKGKEQNKTKQKKKTCSKEQRLKKKKQKKKSSMSQNSREGRANVQAGPSNSLCQQSLMSVLRRNTHWSRWVGFLQMYCLLSTKQTHRHGWDSITRIQRNKKKKGTKTYTREDGVTPRDFLVLVPFLSLSVSPSLSSHVFA